MHPAGFVASNNDRDIADIGADETSRLGNFGFERDIIPVAPHEDLLDFKLENPMICVDPVRNLGPISGQCKSGISEADKTFGTSKRVGLSILNGLLASDCPAEHRHNEIGNNFMPQREHCQFVCAKNVRDDVELFQLLNRLYLALKSALY